MTFLQCIRDLVNPSLEEFIRIAYSLLPENVRRSPWVGLLHGVELLETEQKLNQYLCAYGKMHQEKMNEAFSSVPDISFLSGKDITIVDWGCGQGLATICFFDYLHQLGLMVSVKKIILIEPSRIALERAEKLVDKYQTSFSIVGVNKFLNDLTSSDIEPEGDLVLHFFSNILDIPSVDLERLASLIRTTFSVDQYFFCVGPQNLGATRIELFANYLDVPTEDYLVQYQGRLKVRGTISLLTFRIIAEHAEVVKAVFRPGLQKRIDGDLILQDLLARQAVESAQDAKFVQFYKLILELEQRKNAVATLADGQLYPLVLGQEEGKTCLVIDFQENPDFCQKFKQSVAFGGGSSYLNIGICCGIEDYRYRILQYCYPLNLLQDFNPDAQYLPIELSNFCVSNHEADVLEISEETVAIINAAICKDDVTLDGVEAILRDAISSQLKIVQYLSIALTNENMATSNVKEELSSLLKDCHTGNLKNAPLLSSFVRGNLSNNQIDCVNPSTLVSVVAMDESQRMAIATALESRVAVITGPPGSGKTQMIENLLANALVQGKKVLVASKNNKAVDNVKLRFSELFSVDYLLRFGSRAEMANQLIPQMDFIRTQLPALRKGGNAFADTIHSYDQKCVAIKEATRLLEEKFILLESIDRLADEILRLEQTKDSLQMQLSDAVRDLQLKNPRGAIYYSEECSTFDYLKQNTDVLVDVLRKSQSGVRKLIFLLLKKEKLIAKLNLVYEALPASMQKDADSCKSVDGLKSLLNYAESMQQILDTGIEYKNQITSLEGHTADELDSIDTSLTNLSRKRNEAEKKLSVIQEHEEELLDIVQRNRAYINQMSSSLVSSTIQNLLCDAESETALINYYNYLPNNLPKISSDMPIFVRNAQKFTDVFRLSALTNLSVKSCYPLLPGMFDLVVIDEASQSDIASALPLIYRAKQLVVIGDPLQLKHITSIHAGEEAQIKESLQMGDAVMMRYVNYSLWDYCRDLIASSKDHNTPANLDSHYRCHPRIIGYSNDFFYKRKMNMLLKIRTRDNHPEIKDKGIIWVDVRGEQKSATENINEKEIIKCVELAKSLATSYENASLAVITAFRNQADELRKVMPAELKDRVVVDTVYRFQGDERDIVIYSPVVTDNSPDSKLRWLDYVVPNLINVAVTRARSAFYIVGNKEYIRYHSNVNLPLGFLLDYTERKAMVISDYDARTYVIDTNVFVEDPYVISKIHEEDMVVVPATVIDELDKLKVASNPEVVNRATSALHNINLSSTRANMRLECAGHEVLPIDFGRRTADDLILSVALKYRNHNAILLTSDRGLQNKAKCVGVNSVSLKEFTNN